MLNLEWSGPGLFYICINSLTFFLQEFKKNHKMFKEDIARPMYHVVGNILKYIFYLVISISLPSNLPGGAAGSLQDHMFQKEWRELPLSKGGPRIYAKVATVILKRHIFSPTSLHDSAAGLLGNGNKKHVYNNVSWKLSNNSLVDFFIQVGHRKHFDSLHSS